MIRSKKYQTTHKPIYTKLAMCVTINLQTTNICPSFIVLYKRDRNVSKKVKKSLIIFNLMEDLFPFFCFLACCRKPIMSHYQEFMWKRKRRSGTVVLINKLRRVDYTTTNADIQQTKIELLKMSSEMQYDNF